MSENLPHRAPSATPMQSSDWEGELPARIRAAFPDIGLQCKVYLGQSFIELSAPAIRDVLRFLRDEEQYDMLVDLTAVDHPKDAERFEVLYILYSFAHNHRLRLKLRASEGLEIPSATEIFLAANWLEREVFDMFGIGFSGHPDLKRILMPDEWTGFPLRKDYSITGMDNQWVQQNLGIESGQS